MMSRVANGLGGKRLRSLCIGVVLLMGCSVPIHHGLDEAAANEVLGALDKTGIGVSKTRDDDGSFAISVGRSEVMRALELLRALGLPRGRRVGFGEVYKQPSLVPSASEERARYLEALSGEVARTLESVEGVVSARVHLVLPEPDPLSVGGKPAGGAQAAVLLKVRAEGPAPISEADVQKLVAGSVSGLDRSAVAVVYTRAPEVPGQKAAGQALLGPMRVDPQGRGILLSVGLGVCALVGLLAFMLLLLARRLAKLQHRE